MAGINFMALAEGMMLGDKLNKEDETYWRKQAAEDRAMQYQERDQAFKEQEQGFRLDEYAAKGEERTSLAEIKDVNRLVGQAYDTVSAAAKAQGKEPWQVMLESPDFILEGASPQKQALFNASMRELVKTSIAPSLRIQGKYDEAGRLEQRMGLAVNQSSRYLNSQRLMTDPEFANSELTKNGFTKNEDGTWSKMGVKVPAAVAIGTLANPESGLTTLINQSRVNDIDAQRLGTANQVAAINSTTQGRQEWAAVSQAITNGMPREAIHPSYHAMYDQVMAARPATTGSGSPPIASAASLDTYTAAPASATAAPATIKNVAGPLSDWRNTVSAAASVDPMATAPKTTDEINHRSTSELTAIRYAITTGQRIPGLSPAAMGAYLKVINDEIASRHAAEAKQLSRSSK